MNNITTWLGNNPLTLTIKGSGQYVKEQCVNLVNIFRDAELEREEEFRQEGEEYQRSVDLEDLKNNHNV